MKLDIHTALHLVLALPAHRSHDEGHRQLGKISFDELLQYRDLGQGDSEKAFNRAMIALVLSAVRAFSVERDKIATVWQSIDAVKTRRDRLLAVFQGLSPLSEGNYWTKILAVLGSAGWSFASSAPDWTKVSASFVIWLGILLVCLEIASKLLEYLAASWYEKRGPIEKQKVWVEKSLGTYREIAAKFIADALVIHTQYFPDIKDIQGFDINSDDGRHRFRDFLVQTVFYH